MADEVNRIEATITRRSVEASLQVTLRRLGETHADYAQWDDAVRNLYGTVKQDFVIENFVTSTTDPGVLRHASSCSTRMAAIVFGYHARSASSKNSGRGRLRAGDWPTMIAAMPRGRACAYSCPDRISRNEMGTRGGGDRPGRADLRRLQADAAPSRAILILSKAFDDEAIERLGEDYQIEGLASLLRPRRDLAFAVPVVDPTGTTMADLDLVATRDRQCGACARQPNPASRCSRWSR